MKKIILIISLLFSLSTIALGVKIHSSLSAALSSTTKELNKTLNYCKTFTLNKLSNYENIALDLSIRGEVGDLKEIGTQDITSILILDSSKNFKKGYEIDQDGHKLEIFNTKTPSINLDLGWVSIELDAALRTSKAVYIIPTTNQNFLLITFDLKECLNKLRSLSFGFNSYAYITRGLRENSLSYDLVFLPTVLDRLLDLDLLIQSNFKSNWIFVFKGTYKDVYTYSIKQIHMFFYFLLLIGLSLISFYCYFSNPSLKKTKRLWGLSILIDIHCIILSTFLFWDMPSTTNIINNRTASYRKTQEFFEKNPSILVIPTAVYINSLNFPTDSSFLITGFISQIYPKDNLVEKGFIFPYQSTLSTPSIKEISRWEDDVSITILWQFGIGLSSPFSTKFFPFDKRSAEIILWPKELHKDVVFLPNYFNFQTFSALENPGASKNLDPNGWDILSSSFILKNSSPYDFFPPSSTDSKLTYAFTINLIRNFLGAFLSNILVLFLCMFVAFLVLFIPRDSLLDSLFATISIFVGLIFIAVTNHASLRNTLEVSSFAYVEYLFISFYALILAITIDFILRRPSKTNEEVKSTILAISYWPLLLGIFTLNLIISVLT